MVIRRIVAVLALLIILVGLMQIIFPGLAVRMTEKLVGWRSLPHTDVLGILAAMRLVGVLGLAIGVVFVVAAAKRLVGLRLFVLIVGLYAIVGSAVVFASPAFIRELLGALFLNRSQESQLTVLWASGLLRIGIGAALLYAVAKPPRPDANAGE